VSNVDFSNSSGVNFERYEVRESEYLVIRRGFALRAWPGVFRVDGYVQVDGVLIMGA
jgi:hypothetical protein